jgi:hypothetical protein
MLERWLESAADSPIRGWVRSELEELVRDEHSTFTWLLEPMLVRAAFDIEHVGYSDDRIVAHYICRRASN